MELDRETPGNRLRQEKRGEDSMRKTLGYLIIPTLLLCTSAIAAPVDEAHLPPKTFADASEIQKLITQAAKDHEPGTFSSQYIAALAPYHVNLEYRTTATPPAVHLKEAELIYVISGSGTLTVGGTLENSRPGKPGNLGGTATKGGADELLEPGTFVFVPEGQPHWFSNVKAGNPLVTMAFHVPRPLRPS